MNIILGNLLENAIENTLKTDNPYIELTLKYQSGTIYMNVTNTCISDQKVENGKYLTTKTYDEKNMHNEETVSEGFSISGRHKSGKHGYGLDNVKRCVDKYSGTMKLNCKDDVFTAEVLIYVPVQSCK